jgi:hypothetical protein
MNDVMTSFDSRPVTYVVVLPAAAACGIGRTTVLERSSRSKLQGDGELGGLARMPPVE